MKHVISPFLVTIFILISCNSNNDTTAVEQIDYKEQNEQEIVQYLEANNLSAQKSASGLYYIISESGIGTQPTATDNVTVAYKGYFTDGKVFDSSNEEGIAFGLQQVIKGWTEGITYFKEGGKGTLLIPSHLAYGNRTVGPIPAGCVLIFDIELISVN